MAYGQTGAGKTFTMTGDTGNYRLRGIIPRAVSQVSNLSVCVCLHVSVPVCMCIWHVHIYAHVLSVCLLTQHITG